MLRPWLLLSLACVLGAARPVLASDDVSAEAAFDEGLRAMEEGDLDRACPLFARAVELSKSRPIGGLLTLGGCYERHGKTASAWGAYREAAGLAVQAGDARAADVEAAVARVSLVLRKVTLKVAPALAEREGLAVTIGARPIPRDLFGVPIPVDPGTTTIRLELPGKKPRLLTLTLPPEGQSLDVPIEPWTEEPVEGSPPTKQAPSETRFGGLGIAGVGVTAGGGVLLGAALGTILAAQSDYDDALADEAHACSGGLCNEAGKAAVDDARALGDAATGVFIAGAVLAGAGLTLLIVDLVTVETSDQATVSLGIRGQGACIEGRF